MYGFVGLIRPVQLGTFDTQAVKQIVYAIFIIHLDDDIHIYMYIYMNACVYMCVYVCIYKHTMLSELFAK